MRKLYLDNIRWITVALVVLYHVIYMFNGVRTAGVIGSFSGKAQPQDLYQYMVYPWFMVLLFVVAGICARFYLESHSDREFVKERTRKLLIPSTIGLFVLQWMTGYFNMQIGGAFESMPAMPAPILYLIMSISGTGPLWFIQMLWLYSLLLVWIRKLEKDRLYDKCGKAGVPVLLLWTLVIFGTAQILNVPVVIVYRFGIYGAAFFIGYFVLSHEEVIERLARFWIPFTGAAGVLMVTFCAVNRGKPFAEHEVLDTLLCNVFAWVMVLAIIAVMSKFGNFDGRFCRFMKRQSWGIYILHYLPLAACAFACHRYMPGMPAIIVYLLTGVSAFAGSVLMNVVIEKIPVIRWCVLGIKKR